MQTHLKSRQQQRQSYRDDFPVAARVDDSVAADFDDSKSKKRVNTPRLFFWWRKAKKVARCGRAFDRVPPDFFSLLLFDVVVLVVVF